MKKLLFYFLISACAVSCNLNNRKQISQSEFDRLFAHDSIASVTLYMNKNEAVVNLKSTEEDGEIRVLNIESSASFQDSLGRLERQLASENIHPKYGINFISTDPIPNLHFLSIIELMLLLCTLVLFLYAIIDILRNRFESEINKLIWVLVVVFIPLIGPILYVFIGRKQRRIIE